MNPIDSGTCSKDSTFNSVKAVPDTCTLIKTYDPPALNFASDKELDRPRILAFVKNFKECTYEYFDMEKGDGVKPEAWLERFQVAHNQTTINYHLLGEDLFSCTRQSAQ